MAVYLDAIPEVANKVKRPDTRRWLLLLFFLLFTGCSLTLWFWSMARTGFVFWFTALGVPCCSWGLLFSLRRLAYKAQQVAAAAWNHEREQLLATEICRGQRAAWVLDATFQLPVGGRRQTLAALTTAVPLTTLSQPRSGGRPVKQALFSEVAEEDDIIPAIVAKAGAHIWPVIEALPDTLPCWLLVESDTDMDALTPQVIAEALVGNRRAFFQPVPGAGIAAFDHWLDFGAETPSLLIVVSVRFLAAAKENDTEAVAVLVLSNHPSASFPHAARLHRPEKGELATLSRHLSRALLWADLPPDALKGAWLTGDKLIGGAEWNIACEENGLALSLTTDIQTIDTTLGHAGQVAPWLAIALASQVVDTRGSQIMAAGIASDHNETWLAVISKKVAIKGSSVHVKDKS